MKKFLSLMIISLMILSCFTLTAFAAVDVTVTYTATAADSDGYFTLTAKCDNEITTFMSAISFDASKVVPVNGTTVIKEDGDNIVGVTGNSAFAAPYTNYNATANSLYIDMYSADTASIASNNDIITVQFKKIATISDSDVIFKVSGENAVWHYTDSANGLALTVKGQGESTIADGNATVNFDVTNLVDKKPDPEDWKDTVKDTTTGDIKFPETSDKIGTDNDADLKADAEVKKVVIFAKAVDALTGTKDGSANYGITIGGMYYPGYLSVPAGSNWSIILVDPNNTLTDSYSASVTVNGETKTLENVSFK